MNNTNNVYEGEGSIRSFLNPNNSITPLIELTQDLNPFYNDGVRIYIKMQSMTPLANVKSLPAWNMLEKAEEDGRLKNVDTIIESSSGNTVFSLGVLANVFGLSKTKAIVSHQVGDNKLKILLLFGIDVIINKEPICPDPWDKTSGIYKAKKMAQENIKWFNPGQYDNNGNPEIHKKITGKQIWEQMKGDIQIFCAGLGTTGTMVGTGAFLKYKKKNIKNVGVVRVINNPVPGPRTKGLLQEIAFDWSGVCDGIVEIGTVKSYELSIALCRSGLLVGPSTGFNLSGLLKYLSQEKKKKTLNKLKNKNGEIKAVVIACDPPFPYIDEYFEFLDDDYFSEIENKELLNIKDKESDLIVASQNNTININDFTKLAFGMNYTKLKKAKIKDIILNTNIEIIDIRDKEIFEHFSIPHSVNIPINNFEVKNKKILKKDKDKKIIIVCKAGVLSSGIVNKLQKRGIEAYSLSGGVIEWSEKDLPRIRPRICVTKHSFKEKTN